MSVNVGTLLATLGLDTSAFTRGAADATGKLKDLEGNFGRLGGFAKTAGIALAALGTAAAGAAAAAFALTKQVANQGDELFKLSQRIGISVEKLSGYRLAADLADLSIQEFGQSAGLLARRMQDAAQGQSESADAFRALGIQVTDTTGKLRPVDDIMLEIAEKFAGAEDGAAKTAVAMQLFGRSGTQLIPMLNAGSASLKENADLAERLGLIWTTKSARAAEAFNDSLQTLNGAFAGLKKSIFEDLIPAMKPYVDAVTDWIAANREIIASQIREYLQSLAAAAKDIAPLVLQLAAGFASMVPILMQVVKWGAAFVELVIAGIAGAVGTIAQAVAGLIGLAAKIPGLSGALGGVAADAQDIANTITFMSEEAGKAFERLVSGGNAASTAQRSLTAVTQQEAKKRGTLAVQESDQQIKAREAAEKAIAELRISIMGDTEAKIIAERDAVLMQAKRQYDEDLRAFGQTARGKEVAEERLAESRVAIEESTSQKLSERRARLQEGDIAAAGAYADEVQALFDAAARAEVAASEESWRAREKNREADLEAVGAYAEEVQALHDAAARAEIKQIDEAIKKRQEAADAIRKEFAIIFSAISSAVSTSIKGIIMGTQRMEDAFKRMGESIALSLMDSIVKRGLEQVEKALWDFGGGILSTLLGAFGGFLAPTPAFVPPANPVPIGFFQGGGTVPGPIGMPQFAVVHGGEDILPPGQHRGGGGTTIQQVFNLSPGVPEAVRREVWAMMPIIEQRTVAAVLTARNRGGEVASAVGARR